MSHLSGLHRLDLGDPTYPAVPIILSFPIPSLRRLDFHMNFNVATRVRKALLADVDALLCPPAFQSLKEVCVYYDGPLDVDVVVMKLRNAFAQSHQRGLLQVIMVRE